MNFVTFVAIVLTLTNVGVMITARRNYVAMRKMFEEDREWWGAWEQRRREEPW